LVVVVGPTAVGKTETAIALAEAFDGEIVSADSRQVYVGMDVGTAKPTSEELARARHHLVNYLSPDVRLGLAEYQAAAYAAIDDVLERGKLPLLVGGSGQYVMAVAEGWGVPRVPPDPALRLTLESYAGTYSSTALHARLAMLDPVAAGRLDYRNVRRVVRALEVCLLADEPISDLQRKSPPPYRVLWLGLTRPRPALYTRVDGRIDRMLEEGLVEEVKRLVEQGFDLDLPNTCEGISPWRKQSPACNGKRGVSSGSKEPGSAPMIRAFIGLTWSGFHHQRLWALSETGCPINVCSMFGSECFLSLHSAEQNTPTTSWWRRVLFRLLYLARDGYSCRATRTG
jgi:tRNA dimethylallyltransferase